MMRFSIVAALTLILVACASEILRTPTKLTAYEGRARQVIQISQLTTLTLSSGYERSLLTGSRWERVGSLPDGEVFRPIGTVFTIEGANTHEAYIVLRDSRIVGFYLPGEGAYSALSPGRPTAYTIIE